MKNKRDLNFICAYADVYGMKNRPFIEVYKELIKFFNEGREATEGAFNEEEYKNEFLEKYNTMKEYKLDDEVKSYTCVPGGDFFEACAEWDI